MIDYGRVFHTGFLVDDVAEAMAVYGKSLGLEWLEPVQLAGMPFWSPKRGIHSLDIEFTYSRAGPQHVEIQRGTPGTFYDPALHRAHHVGLWCDDLPSEVRRLEGLGWTVEVANAPPEEGYGLFAYLSAPSAGMMVELVGPGFRPLFEAWLAGENPFA